MANKTGGPGSFTGTGNIFDGVGTGVYTLAGDGFLGLTGNAAATVESGTVADITLCVGTILDKITITALSGGVADVRPLLGSVKTTTFDAAGGIVKLEPGVIGFGAIVANISQGGTYEAYGSPINVLSETAVNFGAGGGTFVIEPGKPSVDVLSGVTINGFGSGDSIVDDAIAGSSVKSYSIASNGTVTFYSGGNETGSLGGLTFAPGTFAAGNYAGATGPLHLSNTSSPLQITELGCFLRGTRIETPFGEVAVETLSAGDLVAVRRDGEALFEPVIWVGQRRIDVRLMGNALDAYPVRIRAGAFADNVPCRDLLVTSEHCVLADGKLVPARMLVNGGSIIVDRSIGQYEYFHVELARHSILVSDGLETESYLDTGNRGNFANAEFTAMRPRFAIDMAHARWEQDAAAPLAVDRDSVEPIWRRLRDRAETIGLALPAQPGLIEDPDLRLVSADGLEIRPMLCDGATYAFVIPASMDTVRLVSRASRPSDVVGPYLDDRRDLGVLVGRIGLGIGRARTVLTSHLRHPALSGWHAAEADGAARWTNGNAVLPLAGIKLGSRKLGLNQLGGAMVYLDIEIVHAGPYRQAMPLALAA